MKEKQLPRAPQLWSPSWPTTYETIDKVGIALVVAILGIIAYETWGRLHNNYYPKSAILMIQNQEVAKLEILGTSAKERKGLSQRTSLAKKNGALFPVNPPKLVEVWMYNMKFPLDIAFIREGRIVQLVRGAQPCIHEKKCPIYHSDRLVDAVIELATDEASKSLVQGAKISLSE